MDAQLIAIKVVEESSSSCHRTMEDLGRRGGVFLWERVGFGKLGVRGKME